MKSNIYGTEDLARLKKMGSLAPEVMKASLAIDKAARKRVPGCGV